MYNYKSKKLKNKQMIAGGASSVCRAFDWRGFKSLILQGIFLPESASSAESPNGVRTARIVISHASTSVRTLKIPDTRSHAIAVRRREFPASNGQWSTLKVVYSVNQSIAFKCINSRTKTNGSWPNEHKGEKRKSISSPAN